MSSVEPVQGEGGPSTPPLEEEKQPGFPEGRIKKIIRLDNDIRHVSLEAVKLVNVSTEMFLSALVAEASAFASSRKRKTVRGEDIRSAIALNQRLRECVGLSISGGQEHEHAAGGDDGTAEDQVKSKSRPAAKKNKPVIQTNTLLGFLAPKMNAV